MADSDWGPWRGGVVYTSHESHAWGVYDNNLFVVTMVALWTEWGAMTHLGIRRKDMQSCSWEDKQRIKTGLVGSSARAIEVYPGDSDVVNQAPVSHLWVLPRGFVLPFGLRAIAGVQ